MFEGKRNMRKMSSLDTILRSPNPCPNEGFKPCTRLRAASSPVLPWILSMVLCALILSGVACWRGVSTCCQSGFSLAQQRQAACDPALAGLGKADAGCSSEGFYGHDDPAIRPYIAGIDCGKFGFGSGHDGCCHRVQWKEDVCKGMTASPTLIPLNICHSSPNSPLRPCFSRATPFLAVSPIRAPVAPAAHPCG